MALFKKKPKDDGKKKIKVVDVSSKVNGKKNNTMWCPMHSCSKLACPGGNHS